MHQHINKTKPVNNDVDKHSAAVQLKDNRPQSIIRQQQSAALMDKQGNAAPIQKKANATGLPDQLKLGIENLSGHAMDDVKVHYNSSQPAQLNAHAYAQGNQIHIAPGQEKHLPHEAWHVVQQKQGRVKPTLQMKGKVNVNDDKGLEHEADVMGAKALQTQPLNLSKEKYGVPLQTKSFAKTITATDTIQPVWLNYNLGNILMWDRKMEGIRWYYVVNEHLMYFQIESPDDLQRTIGSSSGGVGKYRSLSGMENAASREKWLSTDLFGREHHEPEPAPVVDVQRLTHKLTTGHQPMAFGKLQGLESKVDSGSLLTAPVEHTPLFNILNAAAHGLGISVWEMELRLGSPMGYYNSFKADKANAGKESGLAFSDGAIGHMTDFNEYKDYLVKQKKLTGSCGQTSAWLHQITGGLMGPGGGQETPLLVNDFLKVLAHHAGKPFYMRVLTGGHSFIIESSGSGMAIYQSWHGSAPMAFMLERGLRAMSPGAMIEALRKVLMPKNSIGRDDEGVEASKSLFYGQDHKDPTPMVWFNINLNPLTSVAILKNIKLSLHKYTNQWEYALRGGNMEHMRVAENAVDLGPESPPKDMGSLLAAHGLHSDMHKGLTYLHQDQMELHEDPSATRPARIEAPKAEKEVYEYVIPINAGMVAQQFEITSANIIEDASLSSNPIVNIMRNQLKPGEYVFKATGKIYMLTKTDSAGKIGYIFTLKK